MSSARYPRVTVVVTQRETFRHTEPSLESLYAATRVPFDLIYVDGGSPPAVRRRIEAAARRHAFRVLRRERFLSPNEARNLALAESTSELVVFADNDLIFGDAWLERLVECAVETGADVVGPLVCVGRPMFKKIHVAGGDAHIVEAADGRHFRETYRFPHYQVADVAGRLVREPLEMVELHCMLVRRSSFDRAGGFDEGLLTAYEHTDLCMRVRAAGGTVMFEPASIANQLLPALYPFDRDSLPFFRWRWNRESNRATAAHFRAKWDLAPGDPQLIATENWSNDRRDIMFRYLQPRFFRYGTRRLKRALMGKMRT